MRHIPSILVFVAAAGMTGCGQFSGGFGSTPKGGIAVVDLDKVAADTGRDRQLAQSLETAQNSLNQSYAKTVESAQKQLNAKKKEYGDNISESDKKDLSEMERNAVNQLTQIQNKVRLEFENYKQKQIMAFRADLKPIAQEIAAKRGLSIVIPKNESLLLSVDPGVDITEDVVKVLRERHPVPPSNPPPAPAPETAPTTNTAQRPQSGTQKRAQPSTKSTSSSRAANSEKEDDTFR